MVNRTIIAQSKQCDGLEPDNVDGYANPTGFPLTYQDQISYNTFIANISHAYQLGVALKNDVEQIPDLVDLVDFTVNEQCHQYNECEALQPFIKQNKAVFQCEYFEDGSTPDTVCPESNKQGLSTIIKTLDLRAIPLYECLTEYT
uniref:Glycoside-hydrolase family GH114 TIM-barrel domain-containing protein n=2 Tax=Vannella robusta TaxID=1487602 RepID=A0A7S4M5S8_9EUKA|mmetsp:Transcript_12019/g.15002  ORF Transcript_12019/g.15002 Transcript_12019/m.15002 type:complete len:145 (+) Transcript_12019:386-820(+)